MAIGIALGIWIAGVAGSEARTAVASAGRASGVPAAPARADADSVRASGAKLDFSDPVAEAVARAVEYWGGTPCGGTVGVTDGVDSEAPPAGENAPGAPGRVAAMWATWQTPAGRNLLTQPPASFGECVVHVNRAIWPSTQSEDFDFAAFCKEMLHEYGHFEGYSDVGAAPGTIEYERPDLARVPLCESYRLRFGHKLYVGPPSRRPRPPRRRARPPVGTGGTR